MLLPSICILLTFLLYDLPFDVKNNVVCFAYVENKFVANQVDFLINSWLVSLIKDSKLSCV